MNLFCSKSGGGLPALLRANVAAMVMSVVLAGCASYRTPGHLPDDNCATAWEEAERQLQLAGIEDAQGTQIPGYPYLRVNRTLADFDLTALDPEQRQDWLRHALAEGESALRARLKRLGQTHGFDPDRLMQCARQEVDSLATDSRQWHALVPEVEQPDAYLDWRRVVGLYPLLRPILAYQVGKLQDEQAEVFGTPVDGPDARLFVPASPAPALEEVKTILARERAWDDLGLPSFEPKELITLLAHHAPNLMMASGEAYDLPGSPHWDDSQWQVTQPAGAYTLMSRVRWQDQWLPQLVYVFWFDQRPRPHALDLYGGRLDGLIWRVTLDRNAEVLMYESVHACGCYLQWYPNPDRLQLVPDEVGDEIMSVLPVSALGEGAASVRPTLHLQSGTHYVTDVRFGAPPSDTATTRYEIWEYDQLRALPDDEGGHRSLFLPNGLVTGTGRLERFLLWPTGVLSPGGMRQWGHHATAFIGKRHFDDPGLLNRYFRPLQPTGSGAALFIDRKHAHETTRDDAKRALTAY